MSETEVVWPDHQPTAYCYSKNPNLHLCVAFGCDCCVQIDRQGMLNWVSAANLGQPKCNRACFHNSYQFQTCSQKLCRTWKSWTSKPITTIHNSFRPKPLLSAKQRFELFGLFVDHAWMHACNCFNIGGPIHQQNSAAISNGCPLSTAKSTGSSTCSHSLWWFQGFDE